MYFRIADVDRWLVEVPFVVVLIAIGIYALIAAARGEWRRLGWRVLGAAGWWLGSIAAMLPMAFTCHSDCANRRASTLDLTFGVGYSAVSLAVLGWMAWRLLRSRKSEKPLDPVQ